MIVAIAIASATPPIHHRLRTLCQASRKSRRAHPAPGSMAGVEHDRELAAADRLDVDDLEHLIQMHRIRVVQVADTPERVPGCPAEFAALEPAQDLATRGGVDDHPLGLKELHAVVGRGIVRCRDLDSPRRRLIANQPANCRRRRRADQKRIAPCRRHPGQHRGYEDGS